MNLTDCDDVFMKQKELLFLPLVRLVGIPDPEMLPPPYRAHSPPLLLIARTKNAPPHLCNHHQFLRKPIN
ncbi:hypothetical protein KUCAC02_018886 [Chaenocephalus aceratus]|uniref:Uncharacterized protein n=1 Tax=Chaenocephalus aceratus TaxID=36190 RepID=A0ACB9WBD3_CHAAC|nr:hypothetical protein KUCAC02_018886 [Chaenocephalus aceratus]